MLSSCILICRMRARTLHSCKSRSMSLLQEMKGPLVSICTCQFCLAMHAVPALVPHILLPRSHTYCCLVLSQAGTVDFITILKKSNHPRWRVSGLWEHTQRISTALFPYMFYLHTVSAGILCVNTVQLFYYCGWICAERKWKLLPVPPGKLRPNRRREMPPKEGSTPEQTSSTLVSNTKVSFLPAFITELPAFITELALFPSHRQRKKLLQAMPSSPQHHYGAS